MEYLLLIYQENLPFGEFEMAPVSVSSLGVSKTDLKKLFVGSFLENLRQHLVSKLLKLSTKFPVCPLKNILLIDSNITLV